MSLVSTYVRAVDGNLYADPVLRGPGWFICFDDDDPPELVIAGLTWQECKPIAERVMAELGIGANLRRGSGSRRFFTEARDACAFWFDLIAPIPVPRGQAPTTKKIWQGVVYDPRPKGIKV